MNAPLRIPTIAFALALATACAPRAVEVRTAPTAASEQMVQVTNNLSQAINVYVTASGGTEMFLRQVGPNTVEKVAVRAVSSGTTVTFKAVTVDASRTYQSRSVGLTGMFVWSVP